MTNLLRWVRDNEPALAAGLVASGAVATVDQVLDGTLKWQAAVPVVLAALVRQFVFKPANVVVAKRTARVESIVPGPGASR